MKQTIISSILALLLTGLSGCSTAPEPLPVMPQTLAEEFLSQSSKILASGGLAAIGIAESKSLEIALNMAKVNGRIELADLLAVNIESIRNDFIEETGLAKNDPLLTPIAAAAPSITTDHIQGLVATRLNYETGDDGVVTAYALMEISPQLIIDRLTDKKELADLFLNSRTYKALQISAKEK